MVDYESKFSSVGPMTRLHMATIKTLHAQDALCVSCMHQEGMLCGGVRQYYDEDSSNRYSYPRVYTRSCAKLIDKRESERMEKKLLSSGIPPSYYSKKHIDMPFIIGDEIQAGNSRIPLQAYSLASSDYASIWDCVIAANVNGYVAKYLYPPVILHKYKDYHDKERLVEDFVESCDWLVVERLDYNQGASFVRELLLTMIRYRIEAQLPILIRLGDTPIPRNDTELELYKEIQKWSQPIFQL